MMKKDVFNARGSRYGLDITFISIQWYSKPQFRYPTCISFEDIYIDKFYSCCYMKKRTWSMLEGQGMVQI